MDISGIVKEKSYFWLSQMYFLLIRSRIWNSQAMVHELIGIENNKVDLTEFANVPKDQQVDKY